MLSLSRLALLVPLAALLADDLGAQRRKKSEEEITQTLEVLPDPPAVVSAETYRLVFHVAPHSAKGLLSQQVRDGIRALWRLGKGATIVKLRAFVAGTGDMRRVQAVVSEEFTERRLPLPALSVIQVGALPVEGVQVVIESVGVAKKKVNPHGLAFLSGQAVSSEETALTVAPLVAQSLARLRTALASAGLGPADVLRVTCFCSSLDDLNDVRALLARGFPGVTANVLRIQRAYTSGLAECEAVARLRAGPGAPVKFLNPEGLPQSPNYSQLALVGATRVALTGTQLAFRSQDSDVRLAFERLAKVLEQKGASMSGVAMSSIYPLSSFIADKVRAIRFEFYDKTRPPASTMLLFEGLPSLDASFAVDVVAVLPAAPTARTGSSGR